MPRFFDMNNLTAEQQDRLASANIEYEKIQRVNAKINYELLTDEDKEELKKLLEEDSEEKIKQYLLDCTTLHGADEKSALFHRLLLNKQPLVYPPPCSYSYPWYSIIEDNKVHELSIQANNIQDLLDEDQINIEQTAWEVLEVLSSTEAIVTYGLWKNLGFKWKLSLNTISCKDSVSFIVSHHDSALNRITTFDQLKKEQHYQVLKRLENIKLILNPETQDEYKDKLIQRYGGFANGMFTQQLLSGEEMLFQRLNKGLSDYPTEIEIERMVQHMLDDYIGKDIRVDNEGNLLTVVWLLEKISPPTMTNIYLDSKLLTDVSN